MALRPEIVETVKVPTAKQIAATYRSGRKSTIDGKRKLVETGRMLIAVKDSLGFGQWGAWLAANAAELGFGQSVANKLMRAAANSSFMTNLTDEDWLALDIWGNKPKRAASNSSCMTNLTKEPSHNHDNVPAIEKKPQAEPKQDTSTKPQPNLPMAQGARGEAPFTKPKGDGGTKATDEADEMEQVIERRTNGKAESPTLNVRPLGLMDTLRVLCWKGDGRVLVEALLRMGWTERQVFNTVGNFNKAYAEKGLQAEVRKERGLRFVQITSTKPGEGYVPKSVLHKELAPVLKRALERIEVSLTRNIVDATSLEIALKRTSEDLVKLRETLERLIQ